MKRKMLILISLITLYFVGCHGPYKYSNEEVIKYITENKEPKSKTMCAWYCMKAIRKGGCYNCYIYPAYAYDKILPQLGFKKVSIDNYSPKAGDISVLPKNSKSRFGHIAIYNGSKWISDFEQNSIFPNKNYRDVGKYQIFRIEDGWHWGHLHLNITDIPDYITSLKSFMSKKFNLKN